jgi:hypothetical protein
MAHDEGYVSDQDMLVRLVAFFERGHWVIRRKGDHTIAAMPSGYGFGPITIDLNELVDVIKGIKP